MRSLGSAGRSANADRPVAYQSERSVRLTSADVRLLDAFTLLLRTHSQSSCHSVASASSTGSQPPTPTLVCEAARPTPAAAHSSRALRGWLTKPAARCETYGCSPATDQSRQPSAISMATLTFSGASYQWS